MAEGSRGLGEPLLDGRHCRAATKGVDGGGWPPLPPVREAAVDWADAWGRQPTPSLVGEAATEGAGGLRRQPALALPVSLSGEAPAKQAGDSDWQCMQNGVEVIMVEYEADLPCVGRRTSLRSSNRNPAPSFGHSPRDLSPHVASSQDLIIVDMPGLCNELDMVHCATCLMEWQVPLPRTCPHCSGKVARGKLPAGQSLRTLLDEVLFYLSGTDDNDLRELKQEMLSKITDRVQAFCNQVLSAHADAIKKKAGALQQRVQGVARAGEPNYGDWSQEGVTMFDFRGPSVRSPFEAFGDQLRQVQKFLAPYLQRISCMMPELDVPDEMEFVHCTACQLEWSFPGGPSDYLCTNCTRRLKSGHLPQVREMRKDLIAEVRTLKALLFAAEEGVLSVAWKGWLPVPSWPNLLYALQTYSIMMALVMCVALFLGSMMGMFLFVMSNIDDDAPSGTHQKKLFMVFVTFLLPILIFMGSLCISNCVFLLAGQAASVSFPRCRALMLVALLKKQALNISWNTLSLDTKQEACRSECRTVDIWFVWTYLIVLAASSLLATLWTLVFSMGKIPYLFPLLGSLATTIWGVAVMWTFIWGLLTMVLYICCDIYVGCNEELRSAVDAAQMALQKYDVRPGDMERKSRVMLFWMLHSCQLRLQKETLNAQIRWNRRETVPICICGFSLALFAMSAIVHRDLLKDFLEALGITSRAELRTFGSQTNYVKMVLSSIWILLCVLWISRASWRSLPKMLSCPFFLSIGMLALFIDSVLYCALTLGPLSHGRPIPVPLSNHPRGAWVYENLDTGIVSKNGNHPPYPACFLHWGANQELKILDLAILSSYSYAPDDGGFSEGGEVWNHTQVTFTGQGIKAETIFAQDFWAAGRVVVFRFTTEGSDKGTVVLVVKGSSEAFDFYADAGLWTSIAGFQAFMVLVPLLDQLPNQLFAWILEWLPRTRMEKHIFSNIHNIFYNMTHDPRYARDTYLITGHSLGGGIATAAGGSLGIPAVSFSGPGSHFSRWRFGTSEEKAYRSALTVKPEIDVVHKFDRHDELGQYIECRDPHGHYRDAATCHMIGTTTCELWRACGDHRGRDFREMCQQLLGDTSENGKYLSGY